MTDQSSPWANPAAEPAASPPMVWPDPVAAGQSPTTAPLPPWPATPDQGAPTYPAPGSPPPVYPLDAAPTYPATTPYADLPAYPGSYPATYPTSAVPGYPGYPSAPGYATAPVYPGWLVPAQPTRSTNGFAIASLVVSCVAVVLVLCDGVGFVPGVVGAILGHVARRKIRVEGQAGGGMALAGIIVGWVATAIGLLYIALLIALFSSLIGGATVIPNQS